MGIAFGVWVITIEILMNDGQLCRGIDCKAGMLERSTAGTTGESDAGQFSVPARYDDHVS